MYLSFLRTMADSIPLKTRGNRYKQQKHDIFRISRKSLERGETTPDRQRDLDGGDGKGVCPTIELRG